MDAPDSPETLYSSDHSEYIPAADDTTSGSEEEEGVLKKNDKLITLEGMQEFPESVEKSRKRKSNAKYWARNIAKVKRQRGEAYLSSRGKHVPGVALKPACPNSCRKKCKTKIIEHCRQKIFQSYYALGDYSRQRDFIHSNIERFSTKVKTTDNSRRSFSLRFHLPVEGRKIHVCKLMFLNTLGIKKGIVDCAMKRRTEENTSVVDRRGKHVKRETSISMLNGIRKHIEKFPVVESHYCRSGTKRKYLDPSLNITLMFKLYSNACEENNQPIASEAVYRKVFTEEYNLGFHRPKKDQCRVCMSFQNASAEERIAMQNEYDKHITAKENARKEKQNDKIVAEISDGKVVSCNFDLQQVLLCPSDVKNNALFYKRRLTSYNFTIYNVVSKQGDCFMWHESEGGRGSCEISSALFKFLNSLPPTVEEIRFFCDRCGGQNLNKFVAGMFLLAVQKIPQLTSIDLKFLQSGHSEMECDSMHSAIGTEFKRVGQVNWPEDWKTIARSARRKNDKPYLIHSLNTEDIKDWKKFVDLNMTIRKKDEDGNPVNWQKMCWLNFTKSRPLIIRFKETFVEQFRNLNVHKRARPRTKPEETLTQLYNGSIPIPEDKYKNLLSLFETKPKPALSRVFKPFYESLPYSKKGGQEAESFSEEED